MQVISILKLQQYTITKEFLIFNRFAYFWPNGYQHGSLEPPGRRLLKTSNAKNCLPTGIEPAPVHRRPSLAQVIEQWTGNPKTAGSIPVGRQFFSLLVLSSRRPGGSSLGFRAGSR